MIDPTTRALLLDAARSTPALGVYLSEYALSPIWGDAPDAEIPPERIRFLSTLYEATHTTARALFDKYHITCPQFSNAFGVPLRTVQGWYSGASPTPVYVLAMIAEILEYEEL